MQNFILLTYTDFYTFYILLETYISVFKNGVAPLWVELCYAYFFVSYLDDFWSTKYSLTVDCTLSTAFPESISNDTNRTISTNIIVYFPSLYVQLLPHQATWRKLIIHWSLQAGQSEWKSMPHVIRCVATRLWFRDFSWQCTVIGYSISLLAFFEK